MADIPEQNYVELRSEDVQEILGTPPHWLVRWGTAIVLLGFALIVAAAWFIRYPDVVKAPVVVTTNEPPVDVVAWVDGYVDTIFVKDKDAVRTDAVLAVLKSTANYKDVLRLDVSVNAWQNSGLELLRLIDPPRDLKLGEIEGSFADFVQQLENFQFGKADKNAAVNSNIASIREQINQLEQSISFEEKGLKRINDQLKVAEQRYEIQKGLREEGLISEVDFENERTKLANIERQRDAYEDNILRKRNEIISLKRSIADVEFNQQETVSNASGRLFNSLSTLRSAIDKWKQNYLLIAPVDGLVSINSVKENQFLQRGQQVFTVVPPQKTRHIYGWVRLPLAGSGKVRDSLKVIIKLDNFPYQEFGTFSGTVKSKSLVPKDNEYSILVEVDADSITHEMKTSYGKKIAFEQQLQGTAEILTDERDFITRLTDKILLKKQPN